MKRQSVRVLAILFAGTSASANLIYNDGGTHDITTTINEAYEYFQKKYQF